MAPSGHTDGMFDRSINYSLVSKTRFKSEKLRNSTRVQMLKGGGESGKVDNMCGGVRFNIRRPFAKMTICPVALKV